MQDEIFTGYYEPSNVVADERWLAEWVAFGFTELCVYLYKRDKFGRYCDRRDRGES